MTLNTIAQHVKHAATTTRGKIAGGAALLMASAAANAQATDASSAFSEMQSQASEMASSAWPVVVTVVGGLIAIGLFKKFANKAS
ncbi:MAG: hypothetical protein IKE45_16585 [Halomonas sp.]|nr:major coat protein [Halomonas sp.]MBR2515595.1 hypothetical protein [Halomonas sp.]